MKKEYINIAATKEAVRKASSTVYIAGTVVVDKNITKIVYKNNKKAK